MCNVSGEYTIDELILVQIIPVDCIKAMRRLCFVCYILYCLVSVAAT